MTSIRKWFINFNDNLTNLTFHSSSNFYYQIVSAQSIQRNKLSLTSLMSMNSALSLSIIIPIYHSHRFHIYISSSIYNIYKYVRQTFFQREINAIGEPTSQVITNWDATRGTPLGQRGATRDKSPGTEV